MRIKEANTKDDIKKFYQITNQIYKENPYYRSTEDDVIRMLINGPTHFHTHAEVIPFIILDKNQVIGRFALIHDLRMFEYVQVAFFESLKISYYPIDLIKDEVASRYPDTETITIGLNGHLNYGAGILQNNFDKVPVFGLPYTPDYYPNFFHDLVKKKITSFEFPVKVDEKFFKRIERLSDTNTIKIKKFNRKLLSDNFLTYTDLNNRCFEKHPYWSDRDGIEDLELFEPFKNLLKDEHILFAEYEGEPIGFLLWFPDYNQLVKSKRELKAGSKYSFDVLRYKLFNPINTFRFTEIAVDPKFRKKGVELALINQMVKDVLKAGYKNGIGGFIFEENLDSINMAVKYIERIVGEKLTSGNEYAVYELKL